MQKFKTLIFHIGVCRIKKTLIMHTVSFSKSCRNSLDVKRTVSLNILAAFFAVQLFHSGGEFFKFIFQ